MCSYLLLLLLFFIDTVKSENRVVHVSSTGIISKKCGESPDRACLTLVDGMENCKLNDTAIIYQCTVRVASGEINWSNNTLSRPFLLWFAELFIIGEGKTKTRVVGCL